MTCRPARWCVVAGAWVLAAPLLAQVPQSRTDPNGVAIPYPRVRLLQGPEDAPGTTAWLRVHDPFLLYELGRDLVNREFSAAEGAFGRSGDLSVPLYASGPDRSGKPARFARDNTPSCASCP